jgi:hypothetical protein
VREGGPSRGELSGEEQDKAPKRRWKEVSCGSGYDGSRRSLSVCLGRHRFLRRFSAVLYAAFTATIESFPRETKPRRRSSTSERDVNGKRNS